MYRSRTDGNDPEPVILSMQKHAKHRLAMALPDDCAYARSVEDCVRVKLALTQACSCDFDHPDPHAPGISDNGRRAGAGTVAFDDAERRYETHRHDHVEEDDYCVTICYDLYLSPSVSDDDERNNVEDENDASSMGGEAGPSQTGRPDDDECANCVKAGQNSPIGGQDEACRQCQAARQDIPVALPGDDCGNC